MVNIALLVAAVAQVPHSGVWTTPKVINLENDLAKFDVMTDGKGHYIARRPESSDYAIFYGDSKDFYLVSASTRHYTCDRPGMTDRLRDGRFEHYMVDEGMPSTLECVDPSHYRVLCGTRWTELTVLPKEEALALLQKAVFRRSPFDFIPYALARDDKGIYYYVDRGRWTDNEPTFRVFSGKKGNVKPVKLKNVAHDSEGDVFSTARGDLRLILSQAQGWWVQKGKQNALSILTLEKNLPLIFNELGAYEGVRLGTPCDDL